MVICATVLATITIAASPRREKVPSPHWKRDTCATCHTVENGKRLPITPEHADEICLKCHDGRKAAQEFHPVGRPLDPEKYQRPKDWPLVEERLACLTCHDMKPGCNETITRPAANRMLLRDFQAGRKQSKPFCQNCHQSETYQKLNPHVMLLPDSNEIIEEKCLFCHDKPLDRAAVTRTGKPSLKANQQDLCRDCHRPHEDPMVQGHIGLKLSDDMLAYMYVREMTGLRSTVGTATLEQAKAARNKPTKMVGAADNTVVCTTCHNPHQNGVFPVTSELGYRAMRLVDKNSVNSPVRGELWCRHCHEF